jgi:hypothetical protein
LPGDHLNRCCKSYFFFLAAFFFAFFFVAMVILLQVVVKGTSETAGNHQPVTGFFTASPRPERPTRITARRQIRLAISRRVKGMD